MTRVDALDWLRGLLALSVMFYHLTTWQIKPHDASSLLGRLGIYSVSMFFVLSGLSIAIAYHNRVIDIRSVKQFYIARLFRIWPILWFTIIVDVAILNNHASVLKILLNTTTAFGFIAPHMYINVGAWSIGNEIVYYALTPFIIFAYNKSIFIGNSIFLLTIASECFYTVYLLTDEQTLKTQWQLYINPINNLFFYCAGIAIFYNTIHIKFNKLTIGFIFISSFLIFLYYPSAGNQINIVTGSSRITYSIASISIVLSFYKNNFIINNFLSKLLIQLGTITYGVYLLHPVVYKTFELWIRKTSLYYTPINTITITAIITLLTAVLSYKLLENPFIKLGKKLTV